MKKLLPVLVLAAAPIVSGVACSDETIVLAHVPDALDASSEGARCTSDDDCPENAFCARRQCSDVAGTCEPRPVVCEDAPSPVCGCNGITYWNDCLRRTVGVTAMKSGECTDPMHHCDNDANEQCPAGTHCARLLPPPTDPDNPECSLEAHGHCWALPAVCPTQAGSDRWVPCAPPAEACATTCEAIRTGMPHRRATICP